MVGQGASCPSHLKRFPLTKRFHARAVGRIYVDRRFFIYTCPCARLCVANIFLNVQFRFFLVVCVVYAYSMFGCLVASPLWHCRGQQQKQNSIGGPYHSPLWHCRGQQQEQNGIGGPYHPPLWHCRGQQQKQNSIGGPYHPPLWRCHSTEAQQACWVVEG